MMKLLPCRRSVLNALTCERTPLILMGRRTLFINNSGSDKELPLPNQELPLLLTQEPYYPGELFSVKVTKPKDKLLFLDLMEGKDAEERLVGVVCRNPQFVRTRYKFVEWPGFQFGTAAYVVEGNVTNNAIPDKEEENVIFLKGKAKFGLGDMRRGLDGRWYGDAKFENDVLCHSSLGLVHGNLVKDALSTFATLVAPSEEWNTQFQERNIKLFEDGLTQYSFWASMQLKHALNNGHDVFTELHNDWVGRVKYCESLLEESSSANRFRSLLPLFTHITHYLKDTMVATGALPSDAARPPSPFTPTPQQ
eukprot:m.9618 g.9618  ORF g.9618 m.9618 type:complete len:308 (-) comp3500_c0_seq1:59-982(-)